MTPEMIELYKAVQGRRGEWRQWDDVFHVVHGYGKLVDIDLINGKISPYFENGYEWLGPDDPDLLWLPPVWSDDGRCLIGMIERDFSVTRIWYDSDDLTTDDGWIYGVAFIDGEFIGYYNSLPEALLRAIKEQEGKG